MRIRAAAAVPAEARQQRSPSGADASSSSTGEESRSGRSPPSSASPRAPSTRISRAVASRETAASAVFTPSQVNANASSALGASTRPPGAVASSSRSRRTRRGAWAATAPLSATTRRAESTRRSSRARVPTADATSRRSIPATQRAAAAGSARSDAGASTDGGRVRQGSSAFLIRTRPVARGGEIDGRCSVSGSLRPRALPRHETRLATRFSLSMRSRRSPSETSSTR